MNWTQEQANQQNARFDEAGRRRGAKIAKYWEKKYSDYPAAFMPKPKKRISQSQRPTLNQLEADYRDHLKAQGYAVREQSITLRLDPPFKSYRPDLYYLDYDIDRAGLALAFVECKGPHRFREKGIAKLALAAKTYPEFNFVLVERDGAGWKETRIA